MYEETSFGALGGSEGVMRSAVFSPCGAYRYRLDRHIDMLGGPTIGFCLHNPSTACADKDDPTSRRGVGFVTAWGGSRLIYVNPWAGCATKPSDLWLMDDPVGPECDEHILSASAECAGSGGFMVAAWGAVNPPVSHRLMAKERIKRVETLIRSTGCDLRVLSINQNGSPKHPLYVRADTVPVVWEASSGQQ